VEIEVEHEALESQGTRPAMTIARVKFVNALISNENALGSKARRGLYEAIMRYTGRPAAPNGEAGQQFAGGAPVAPADANGAGTELPPSTEQDMAAGSDEIPF